MIASPPLLIVDIDHTAVFPADALAQSMGLPQAEVMLDVEQAFTALAQRKSKPQYVVVDIGLQAEDVLGTIEQLMHLCDGSTRFVVVGNVNDLHFYRSLRAIGVIEYFTHPVRVDEVRAALQQSSLRNAGMMTSQRTSGHQGKVITFIAAASGDGASTAALNVAYSLARDTRQQVVLVDMDYQFGMVARHLDLQAPFGLRELFEYPERGVDATLVSKMLLPYGDHLKIIAAPETLRMLPQITPEVVREFIGVLRAQFDFVVLDMPHTWLPWTAEALLQSDRIVIVAQLWLRSLMHISRMMAAWQDVGILSSNVMLAANRSGARYREAITPQDFERVCLKPINFYLANDIKTVVAGENQGKPLIEVGSSMLERQIRDMSKALYASLGGSDLPASEAGGTMNLKTRFLSRLTGKA